MSAVDELLGAARTAGLEVEERWSLLHDNVRVYLIHSRQQLGSGGEIHEWLFVLPPMGGSRTATVFTHRVDDGRDDRRISIRAAHDWITVRAKAAS